MTEMIIDILGPAHLATAEALCGLMLERGVTPAQLLAAIRQHNARAVAAMAAPQSNNLVLLFPDLLG